MPPVYSTPKNRRIDEHVLASLRKRNLVSSMEQHLDEMGIVESEYKSPSQVRSDQDRMSACAKPFAMSTQGSFKGRSTHAIDEIGEDKDKHLTMSDEPAMHSLEAHEVKVNPLENEDFNVIESTAVRKSSEPLPVRSEGNEQHNPLGLSEAQSADEDIERLLLEQERELEKLKSKNADLIELFEQSNLMTNCQYTDSAIECQIIASETQSNYDIYEITEEDDDNGREEKQIGHKSMNRRAVEQSEKLELEESEILELSEELNKQKEYENQLIEELMKMQKMVQGDEFKEETIRRDRELIQRNRQLEQQNEELQRELQELSKHKNLDNKYSREKEKYALLKQKFVGLEHEAEELNDILENEQNETEVVIKELVQDIEDMKLRSQKKAQDE